MVTFLEKSYQCKYTHQGPELPPTLDEAKSTMTGIEANLRLCYDFKGVMG
jgi:hypothetical protein